ncbi:hypothetical protein BJ878DRAFT_578288 [Calycina marina]|uniref:FAD-binding FR-type domain-containing protein n=1 Tax=Calycina marina TaxID=1763456 RepID=A0A9P8CDJ9_9HELO|nr:hypothetical protein BJ878DRAFT_578288 [Calycina marina]
MRLSFCILLSWLTLVFARISGSGQFCLWACQQVLRRVSFNTTTLETGWRRECTDELTITLLYLSLGVHFTSEECVNGLQSFNKTCQNVKAPLPPFSLVDNYRRESRAFAPSHPNDHSNASLYSCNELVIPSSELFGLTFKTLDVANYEHDIRIFYGNCTYYFWIVSIRLMSRLCRFLATFVQGKHLWQAISKSDGDDSRDFLGGKKASFLTLTYALLKLYITVQAMFGYTRSLNIKWCTIPTRVQSMAIAVFVIINVVTCALGYDVFTRNVYWAERSMQAWRYVADRSGAISTANLVVIWAFGLRNNLLLHMDNRLGLCDLQQHPSLGRSGCYCAGNCAFCRVHIFGDSREIVVRQLAELYGLLSSSLVRSRRLDIFSKGFYTWYIWSCVMVWILDRVFGILRILTFDPRFWNTKAIVSYELASDIVRLTVPNNQYLLKPEPGTFYYITSPNDAMIWQSHPFTLGYSTFISDVSSPPGNVFTTNTRHRKPTISFYHHYRQSRVKSAFCELHHFIRASNSAQATPPPRESLVFIIRPYNGFTMRLKKATTPEPASLQVLIDGTYGETQPFHTYGNVLFVVGGTGVALPLSYLSQVTGKDCASTAVHIIWAVRDHKFLMDAIAGDFRGHLPDERLSGGVR